MKIQPLIIAFQLIYLTACDKTQLPTKEELGYWGTITATKNNMAWVGAPISLININHGKGFEIVGDSLDKYGTRREALGFTKVPSQTGTYPLVNTIPQTDDGLVGASYFILDDDVTLGNYKVLVSDSSSFITLISFDSISKELKGTFDITLIVDHRPYASYPDTIRFRNGQFHTRLKE